ncbi:MAG: hypothetical protein ACREFD_13245 [Stellaceae bacterium]
MTLTLYHNDVPVCAQKVRMALTEKGLSYDGRNMNLGCGDTTDPAYLPK